MAILLNTASITKLAVWQLNTTFASFYMHVQRYSAILTYILRVLPISQPAPVVQRPKPACRPHHCQSSAVRSVSMIPVLVMTAATSVTPQAPWFHSFFSHSKWAGWCLSSLHRAMKLLWAGAFGTKHLKTLQNPEYYVASVRFVWCCCPSVASFTVVEYASLAGWTPCFR